MVLEVFGYPPGMSRDIVAGSTYVLNLPSLRVPAPAFGARIPSPRVGKRLPDLPGVRLSLARLLSEVGRCPTRPSTRRARSP
jgi:hypothetical protein